MDEEALRQQIDLLQKDNAKLTRQLARLQATVDRNKAVAASFTNINAMREVERKKQQQYLQLMLENSPDIIILFDDSRRFAHCTNTFLKAARIPHFSFVNGREFKDVFSTFASPEWVTKVSDSMDKAVEGKQLLSFEEALDLDGGGPRRYQVYFTPMTGIGDVADSSLMLFHDITDIREAQENAELAREAAEHASMVKSEFLANMSHEIRTPMNAILGLTHLALQTELDEQQYEYIHRTEVAAKALLRIINDILDFSKIEAGKLEMEETEFHLVDLMRGIMEMHVEKAHATDLEFALDLPIETPCGLLGDPVRLAQIINNLIGNAIKFTGQGGTVIVRVATLESTPETAFLRFTVEDSGIGLTPEQAAKLFNPFTQADTTTTRKYGGTGLGLAISKRLAEMMDGEIWCRSEPGRGSTFGFTARFKPCVLEGAGPALTLDAFKGLRVLAVDDNDLALEILSQDLSSMGFTVVAADSGEEALKCYAEAVGQGIKFDLIVVDWHMPGLDGGETVRRLAEAWGTLPAVLMVTGFGREEVADSAKAANIKKILTKPISISSLNDALMEVFDRRQAKPGKKKGGVAEGDLALIEAVRGARILLAEDNEVNQLVASRILTNAGFEVTIAGNGLEALDLAQKERFDIVLMDIQMPEMDGLTAAARLRAMPQFQDLPIVAMTAHAMSGDREQSLKVGMNDHITKPINISELFKALARWLPPRSA